MLWQPPAPAARPDVCATYERGEIHRFWGAHLCLCPRRPHKAQRLHARCAAGAPPANAARARALYPAPHPHAAADAAPAAAMLGCAQRCAVIFGDCQLWESRHQRRHGARCRSTGWGAEPVLHTAVGRAVLASDHRCSAHSIQPHHLCTLYGVSVWHHHHHSNCTRFLLRCHPAHPTRLEGIAQDKGAPDGTCSACARWAC